MANPETLLPPGFRFHPTDEELILHYLRNRAASLPCPVSVVAEVDIYKFDPWDLPAKAMYGDREWYFFSPRDRKYPNGVRPNRAAGSGYWKATGTDKVITATPGGEGIGVKKALVFYKGRPPKGSKTNWIMHEYRLSENPAATHARAIKASRETSMRLDDWVLCRIYNKCASLQSSLSADRESPEEYANPEDMQLATVTTSVVPPQSLGGAKLPKNLSFCDLFDDGEYSALARLLCDNPLDHGQSCHELGPLLDLNQNSFFLDSVADVSSFVSSLPKLNVVESPSSDSAMSCMKRRRTEAEEEGSGSNTKKPNSLCMGCTSFSNHVSGAGPDAVRCNILNSTFLDDSQLLLKSLSGLHRSP